MKINNKKLLVDFISDIHIDFYNYEIIAQYLIDEKASKILIISGDIGHYIKDNLNFVKILANVYEHVLIVLGNHDLYIEDLFNDSKLKMEYSIKEYNKIKNVHCFNGDTIEIENIVFGGSMSWYDGSYIKKYFNNMFREDILNLWKKTIYDSEKIFFNNKNKIDFLSQIFMSEYLKLNNIKNEIDVMITHINPSILQIHQNKRFEDNITTGFFCFDGYNLYKDTNIKYWFFGHTHDNLYFKHENIEFLCNPFGYPRESMKKYKFLNSILLIV